MTKQNTGLTELVKKLKLNDTEISNFSSSLYRQGLYKEIQKIADRQDRLLEAINEFIGRIELLEGVEMEISVALKIAESSQKLKKVISECEGKNG